MSDPPLPGQTAGAMRRQGYRLLGGGSALVHGVLAVAALPAAGGDGQVWPPAVAALLSAALLLAAVGRRVPLRVLDTVLLWGVNLGALYFTWAFARRGLPLGAAGAVITAIFFAVWASVLPARSALLRGGLLLGALLLIAPPHRGADLAPVLYLGLLALLIAQLSLSGRRIQRQLAKTAHYAGLALTDALTGLPNRRWLEGELQARCEGARAASGAAFALLLIDVDYFKTVNDLYGHAVGDRVLGRVGQVLRAGARAGERVVRWGGEEFVMLVETADRAVLEQLGARLRRALREEDGELPNVTVSIGAALSAEALDAADLLRLADRRLYRAKHAGRDRLNLDPLSPRPTRVGDLIRR